MIFETDSGFLFTDPTDWAAVIPGSEEAGLAWIAANYLNGTLNTIGEPTIGIIEMGGGTFKIEKIEM